MPARATRSCFAGRRACRSTRSTISTRVDEIERLEAEIAGFALAGNAYRGVGVPNALESGERAVSKVLSEAGITLVEDAMEEKRVY